MDKRERFKGWILLLSGLFPGSGHLIYQRYNPGIHLMVGTLVLYGVLILSWDRFSTTFSHRNLDEWTAALSMILAWLAMVGFSVSRTAAFIEGRFPQINPRTPTRTALRRFRENQLAVFSVYVIAFFCLVAVLAPFLAPHDPSAIENVLETRYLAPSWQHPFGTDEFGRDLFSRALFGARISLSVGLLAAFIAVTVGTVYGSISGYFGGIVDDVMMRFVDIFIAFPTFFLLLGLVGIFEASVVAMVFILGLTAWPGTARFIRAEVLSLKQQPYAEAAHAIGLPHLTIIFKHLVPNGLAPILTSAAMMVSGMIGAESGLSFLGIGIRPPTPTWGNMMSQGRDVLLVAWWVALFPGGILALTMLSFNLLADGFRDALDPKTLVRNLL